MKRRTVKPINPSSKISGFQEDVLNEKNSETRERKLVKAMNSLKQEPDVINKYKVVKSGNNFKIDFSDGRRVTWPIGNLPADWLEILWQYAITYHKLNTKSLSIGNRLYYEPGGLFDSNPH